MGNRAVIALKKSYVEGKLKSTDLGVYLHWNGGRDSVEAFLEYCKLKGFRTPESDNYGWARLCQVIANFLGGDGLSIGIDTLNHLDCHNGDNGVYLIDGWDIVGRVYFNGREQDYYERIKMLKAIDESQPEEMQLGEKFFDATPVELKDLEVGDEVVFVGYGGDAKVGVVEEVSVKGNIYSDGCTVKLNNGGSTVLTNSTSDNIRKLLKKD